MTELLLPQVSPLLKGLWHAELLEETALLEWADEPPEASSERLRRFAAPLVAWLRSAALEEEELP